MKPQRERARVWRLCGELDAALYEAKGNDFHAVVYPSEQPGGFRALISTDPWEYRQTDLYAVRDAAREVVAAVKARTAAMNAFMAASAPLPFDQIAAAREDLAEALAWLVHVVDGGKHPLPRDPWAPASSRRPYLACIEQLLPRRPFRYCK